MSKEAQSQHLRLSAFSAPNFGLFGNAAWLFLFYRFAGLNRHGQRLFVVAEFIKQV